MQTAIKTAKTQITLFLEDRYISARGGKSVYIDYGQQLRFRGVVLCGEL
jgi:hypothetical protein